MESRPAPRDRRKSSRIKALYGRRSFAGKRIAAPHHLTLSARQFIVSSRSTERAIPNWEAPMPKQKKSKVKASPAKPEKKELSAEELDSVAGGVGIIANQAIVDTTLSSVAKKAPVTSVSPVFNAVSDKDLTP
jgi:hypothetical protein